MSDEFSVQVRFFQLSEELQPYFTALYSFEIDCRDGILVKDRLHPEWAAMRFIQSGEQAYAAITPHDILPTWPFVISGPTSRAIKFGLQRSRIWGLGLQPAGWAKYVALPASELADRIVDASAVAAMAIFAPILDAVRAGAPAEDTARRINHFLLDLAARTGPVSAAVLSCQEALRDPEIAEVEQLAQRVGIGRRSLERLCARYFGFPPQMLLRRQRFLRSLARFTLEPMPSWSSALDVQYYDHAHFVRDFRRFMGTTPTEYAAAPHPVLDRIMAQRMADQGVAPPTDLPTVLRYGASAAYSD